MTNPPRCPAGIQWPAGPSISCQLWSGHEGDHQFPLSSGATITSSFGITWTQDRIHITWWHRDQQPRRLGRLYQPEGTDR